MTTGTRTLLLLLFLLSGVSGLVYQVVWTRMFALVLGTTVYSVATVLGVFMGGLALGSYVFGKRVDRPGSHGMRLYGWLELAIGVYAFALPWVMQACDRLYQSLWPSVEDSAAGQLVLRVGLAAIVLLVPTTLMGGTLPALSRFLVRTRQGTGREIGNLYAINTMGALLGCFFTGFFLLQILGVRSTLFLAGAVNLGVGGLALAWSRGLTPPPPLEAPASTEESGAYSRLQLRVVLFVFAISGMSSLALEVLWTRALMYFISVDVWAFTAMLSAFLFGIGLGSFLMSRSFRWVRDPLYALAIVELAIGVTAGASILLLSELYGLAPDFGNETLSAVIINKLAASFVIMLVPALLMGAAFPLVSRIYVGAGDGVGASTGTLYACNTIGAIFGSLGAGFVAIPLLGIQGAILAVASVFVLMGLIVLSVRTPRVASPRLLLSVGVAALLAVSFLYRGAPVVSYSAYLNPRAPLQQSEGWKLIYHRENADASIAVIENANGTRALNINGVVTAADNYLDMQVHRMLSHLPILLHQDPESVLVVGFGMGSTVWGSCQHDIAVDVVELLREEKNTARFFAKVNHDVLDPMHPRLRFIAGDGRNYLLATKKRYDIISFNAIHPRFSANLYTRDFYAMCRERMTDDGVICAWMTQNAMQDHEWRMLCRSFVDVFPESSLWYCNPEHFCLIGHKQRRPIDFAAWQSRMQRSGVAADLADSNLADPRVLLARYLFGGEQLRRYVADAPLNTDDRPLIEFSLEQKRDERRIIERLVELREPVPVGGLSETDRAELDRRREATALLMRGQIDFWYPMGIHRIQPRARSQIALRKAFLMYPADGDIRQNLGLQPDLRRELQARAAADPEDFAALQELGRIALDDGDLEQAAQHLEAANRLRPADTRTLELLGFTWLFLAKNDQSGGAFNRLFEIVEFATSPETALAMYGAGVALGRLGHPQGSEWMRRAQAQLPEVTEWFVMLERCALRRR